MKIKRFITKKVVVIGIIAGLILGAGGAAFAFFGATGSGTGIAYTGNAADLTITQTSITVNSGDGYFYPGDNATVDLSLVNGTGGNQYASTIILSSWTSGNPGTCASTIPSETDWFTMTSIPVNANVGPGTTPEGSTTIYFNESGSPQNACAGQTITFNYALS